jgi:type I restriction enzyme S subunit
MNIKEKNTIPQGWALAKLSDVAHFINGKAFKSQDWRSKGIPIIRIQNLNNANSAYNYISESQHVETQYKISNGDLLFAWSGTPGTSFGAHIWDGEKAYLNQHIFKIIPFKGIEKMFLYYALNYLVIDFIIRSKGTAGLSHITKTEFESTAILIPSTEEQLRIVDRIEGIFSELEQAERTLKATQKKLILYSHVVFNDAFKGKLRITKTQSNIEPEKLVSNIKLIKEESYKNRLLEWEKYSKKLEKEPLNKNSPVKPKRYKEVYPLSKRDIGELPSLPKSWAWIKINDITLGVDYGSSSKSLKIGKVPVLRMGNIQNCSFQWQDLVYTNDNYEINKYWLKKNDVLFNRTNSPELVGKSAIFKGEQGAIFAGYLIRLNQISNIIHADYLNYYLNSPIARKYGNKVKTDAVNQSNINGDKLINYPLPICSLSEQAGIVEEIEYRLTIGEKLKETISLCLNKIHIFRHKIFDMAMNGKISSQTFGDGSAELLLEQILREKEKYFVEQKIIKMTTGKKRERNQKKQSVIFILKSAGKPVSAKDVWLQSEHSNDIEEFYAELKRLKGKVVEIKKDTESLLTLSHENR